LHLRAPEYYARVPRTISNPRIKGELREVKPGNPARKEAQTLEHRPGNTMPALLLHARLRAQRHGDYGNLKP
jgi:hypothetical protein